MLNLSLLKTGCTAENKVVRIMLISHAATPALRRVAFPLDESLEESQICRLKALKWCAPRWRNVFCAPERRTSETASLLGLAATIDHNLRDCDYGRWNGSELSAIQEKEADNVATWLAEPSAAPHGGESITELVARVGRWLNEGGHKGYIVAVTHPAFIRGAIVTALRAPDHAFWRIDIAPLSLTDLRHNGRAWSVRAMGCAVNRLGGDHAADGEPS